MEKQDIMNLFIKNFNELNVDKEYYNSLTDNDKMEMILDLFDDAVAMINEDNIDFKEMNPNWYESYMTEICELYEKYLSE